MIVSGVSWLVAGAVAGTLSESASQLPQLREARKINLGRYLSLLKQGLADTLRSSTNDEFLKRYADLLQISFRWLLAQLRLTMAHLLVGGGVYMLAYLLLSAVAIEFLTKLGPLVCDVLFVIGAAVTYIACKLSRPNLTSEGL